MIPALLAKIGVPALAGIISKALSGIDNPAAKAASDSLGALGEAINRGEISDAQLAEANRHTEAMAQLELDGQGKTLSEINQSLRAEVASSDAYVRRMRPTFGYLMALTWALQMIGLAYVIVFDTANAPVVLQAMGSLGTIWTVGLSVLGIYVYKRSEDKKRSF